MQTCVMRGQNGNRNCVGLFARRGVRLLRADSVSPGNLLGLAGRTAAEPDVAVYERLLVQLDRGVVFVHLPAALA